MILFFKKKYKPYLSTNIALTIWHRGRDSSVIRLGIGYPSTTTTINNDVTGGLVMYGVGTTIITITHPKAICIRQKITNHDVIDIAHTL